MAPQPSDGAESARGFRSTPGDEGSRPAGGRQAVNLWAKHYKARTVALAPFASRDGDVLDDREALKALGKMAGAKLQFFPAKLPTNEIGVVIAKDHNGLPFLIEVLRYVHAVANAELREPVYTLAVGGIHIQARTRLSCCRRRSRTWRIAKPGGWTPGHVLILAQVLPAYLEDLEEGAVEGEWRNVG